MKLAEKIIFLWNDPDGFASSLTDSLNPNPNSPLHKLEEQIQLPLDKYGIKDVGNSVSIIHFVDNNGTYQVTVILLGSYETPVLVCAMNELLDKITTETSILPTIVAPFFIEVSKVKFDNRAIEAKLYCFQVGSETETSVLFASTIEKLPKLTQICYEPLSCLVHLARVKGLSTSVLIGQRSSSVSQKALDEEIQVIREVGEVVAGWAGLSFSRDGIKWNVRKILKEEESPWRALYG